MSRRRKDYEKIKRDRSRKKAKKYFAGLIGLSPILFLALAFLRWPIYNSLLDNYGVKTKATIINEKNFMGKGIITQMFSYSYEFCIQDKCYEGDSKDRKYKVGNKLQIEYLELFPQVNRPYKN